MDSVPNEVLYIIFDHLNHYQRKNILHVSKIWCYLINTFAKIPKSYIYSETISLLNTIIDVSVDREDKLI